MCVARALSRHLELHSNELEGTIPTTLSLLSALTYVQHGGRERHQQGVREGEREMRERCTQASPPRHTDRHTDEEQRHRDAQGVRESDGG